ncbi:MAG: hypothetical protein K6T83_11440 [Alicyclobacillus sp.]|nr:hypothetical protein [Alicyclobacillus sp.]
MHTFIGLDVGTSSLKAARIQCNSDGIVRVLQDVHVPYSYGGEPVRSPGLWIDCARSALRQLGSDSPQGIGITGQMHALVMLSRQGGILNPTLLWLDMHGSESLQEFIQRFPNEFVSRTSNIPLPDFTLAKWLYASKVYPSVPSNIQSLLGAKDFVRVSLDPYSDLVTDPSEATGTQLYNPFLGEWDYELADAARIPRSALPPVRPANSVVGSAASIDPSWKDAYLVVGTGDQAAAARAVGAILEGVVSISLGTSAVISAPWKLTSLPSDWDGALHMFPGAEPGLYTVIATIPAFGPALEWISELFHVSLVELDNRAACAHRDHTLVFVPYLNGSGAPHPNNHVRALLRGISLQTSCDEIIRAIYDGLAMELASLIREIETRGIPVHEVVLSGGASQLKELVKTIAEFIGVPCYTVQNSSASAVGAALVAYDALKTGEFPILGRQRVAIDRIRNVSDSWMEARYQVLHSQGGV